MIQRALLFVYGVACYAVFLASFLYAIGFIGGFLVPTRLDGPAQGSVAAALAVDLGLLTVFALQHSVMARRGFKAWWTRIVPKPAERATYTLLSSLALFLMFWQWRPLGGVVWEVETAALRGSLYGVFFAGLAIVLASTFLINHFDLFGLRQVWLHLIGKPYTPLRFRTPLLYRLVRHPLYVGWLLTFWATPTMTAAHLVFAIATTAYILIAIRLEERDLVHEHGASYEAYRASVPMLVPSLARTSRPEPAV